MAKSTAKPTRPSAPTAAQRRLSAQRAAAARERIQSAQRRRRIITVVSAVGAVVVLVAALLVARAVLDKSPKSGTKATAASASVTQRIATVPASVFNKIGTGGKTAGPTSTNGGSKLTSGGKPSILFVGAEFCPYCAGERWAIATALSRFGTFHNLGQVRSSPDDVYANTATLSFHGSTFTSKYLSFAGKEVQSNQVVGNNYGSLDKLNKEQTKLFAKASGYPYLNIAGKYTLNQVQYNPGLLKGKNQQQIADALSDPNSPIAQGVIGSANRLTAALCKVTGGKPASVCTSSGVEAASG